MTNSLPQILSYATPRPINRFAAMPIGIVVLLAMVVPGLSSSLLRGSPKRCLLLFPLIPLAFLFFGPFWGEILFRDPRYSELGLYPFIVSCVAVEVVSVVLAFQDKKRAMIELVQ